jgi:CheY-like chemotaxis protein
LLILFLAMDLLVEGGQQLDESRFDREFIEGNAMCVQTVETVDEAKVWHARLNEERCGDGDTILFVEDELFVREVTCEVLQVAGYRVLAAKSSAEAARIYEVRGADVSLLLTDVVLPGETGRALARRLRQSDPDLPVLLISGYSEQMGLGGDGQEECLAKPFSSDVLLLRIKKLLGRVGSSMERPNLFKLACRSA